MTFKYKGKSFRNIDLFGAFIKDYGTCPECGNDSIGGTPSSGSMHFDGEFGTFERTCKCGWTVNIECEKM